MYGEPTRQHAPQAGYDSAYDPAVYDDDTPSRWTFPRITSLIALLLMTIAGICILVAAVGCAAIQGGQSRHDTLTSGGTEQADDGAYRATIPTPAGVIRIEDTRRHIASTQPTESESIATTQPSVRGGIGAPAPNIETTVEGSIGGVKFAIPKPSPFSNVWPIALGFLGIGAFSYYTGKPWLAVICVCCAGVTLLYPLAMLWALVGVGAVDVYLNWGTIKRLVLGAQNVIKSATPESVQVVKDKLAAKQAGADATIVRTVLGK